MTTEWTCPRCGQKAHVGVVTIKDGERARRGLDGAVVHRRFPTHCTNTLCEYHDGFPDGVALPAD